MIFVTVGSQKFQFNRLLKAVDEIDCKDVIFAQIGYSDYLPKNYSYKRFLNRDEFKYKLSNSDIVITHGGTGIIVSAIKNNKKVIAVPRLSKFKEHVDDHQLQLIKQFGDLNLIYSCYDMNLKKALEEVNLLTFRTYKSNTINIIKDLESYIEKI